MQADLMALLSSYFKRIHEFGILMRVEETELEAIEKSMERVKNNLYVQTCDDTTLREYEQLLGIIRESGANITHRRQAVLTRMNQQLPYSLPKFKEMLDAAVGRNWYRLDVRYSVYELELNVIDQPYKTLKNIQYMAEEIIPAHLQFIFAGLHPVEIPIDVAVTSRLEMSCAFYARYNRKFLYIDGTWLLDGTYKLNGYKEMESLDLYLAALTIRGSWRTTGRTGECVSCTARARADPELQSVSAVIGKVEVQRNNNATLRMLKQADVSPGVGSQLTVEKDLWYLDGTYMLDGSKLLDAEIFYYDL